MDVISQLKSLFLFNTIKLIYYIKVNSVNSQNQKVRLYTTILCLTEENIAFRKDLLDFFKSKMSKSEEIDKINLKAAPISQNLHLIIKRYDFPNSFSSFIHQSNHESFELQGPHVRKKTNI